MVTWLRGMFSYNTKWMFTFLGPCRGRGMLRGETRGVLGNRGFSVCTNCDRIWLSRGHGPRHTLGAENREQQEAQKKLSQEVKMGC